MRLTCPNCDAQYEVPKDVIPTEGRDVQCSNCGQTWFQHHPDHAPAEPMESAEAEAAPAPAEAQEAEEHAAFDVAPAPQERPAPERQSLDPEVSDILRQEAERETRARATEATGLETQPELGLPDTEDEAAKRAREARDRMARMRGQDPEQDTVVGAAVTSRRDLLPDIEEINSTLRSTSDRQISSDETGTNTGQAPRRARSGFRRGFFSVVILAILAAILYLMAPTIVQSVPALEPVLSSYTGTIDQARVWLDVQVQGVLQSLDDTAKSLESE